MEQAELKERMTALKAVDVPPAEPLPEGAIVINGSQVQADHQQRTSALKAADPDGRPPSAPGKKVAILGFTESWRQAPFDDPTWEIWGLNELYMFIPRWTRWFEIHSRETIETDKKRTADHIYGLRAMSCPVYMQKAWPDIPNAVEYPLGLMAQAFPNPAPGGRPYFTNSISYMLALAIYEGFDEIGVYGVDMAHSTEYQQQRPSCEYFIGIAQGRGIKVTMPPDCELLKTDFLYGWEQALIERWNARMQARETDLTNKINQLDAQIAQMSEARAQYRGALQDSQHIRQNWQGLLSS